MPVHPDVPDLPCFSPAGADRVSVHGTAVALEGRGLLIVGPAGAGKSGTATEMLALGAKLVADDLVLVAQSRSGPLLQAPLHGPSAIELRGLGVVPVDRSDDVPLRGVLLIAPSPTRVPEPQTLRVLGADIPLLRHPYGYSIAAKVVVWLGSLPCERPGLDC